MKKLPSDAPIELDLLYEWLAYPGLSGWHIRQLANAGVDSTAWITAGHLATPRISTVGRLFISDPFGGAAFVLPVYDGEPVGELNPDPMVPLIDLLAFRLEEPDRWWLRCGIPNLVLGKNQLINAMLTGSNTALHATPLEWLRAGCEGCCPLDLAADLHEVAHMRERLESLEAAA